MEQYNVDSTISDPTISDPTISISYDPVDIENIVQPFNKKPKSRPEPTQKLTFAARNLITQENELKIKEILEQIIKEFPSQNTDVDCVGMKIIESRINTLKSKSIVFNKVHFRQVYMKYFSHMPMNPVLNQLLTKKAVRSNSGVIVITIVLKPDAHSCTKNCAYCPLETNLNGEPTQSRSYLSSEQIMQAAVQQDFIVRNQFASQIKTRIKTGNVNPDDIFKIEVILSGGSWESYALDYREQVMREIYWAANIFFEQEQRQSFTLEQEQEINQTSKCRIIGLTIETRPDFVTKSTILSYRRWGVTRIQIGVQHWDNDILESINRECTSEQAYDTIKLLKQVGYKIVIHLMPDLPGSTKELDVQMLTQTFVDQRSRCDDIKCYPCIVPKSSPDTPELLVKSDIADWYEEGLYKPYTEANINNLIMVLLIFKMCVAKFVRLERIVRDFPGQSVNTTGTYVPNLRQMVTEYMSKLGANTLFDRFKQTPSCKYWCKCIRCAEVRHKGINTRSVEKIAVHKFFASDAYEYFITVESCPNLLTTWFDFNPETNFGVGYWELIQLSLNYLLFVFTNWARYLLFGQITWWRGQTIVPVRLVGFCRLRLDPESGAGIIPSIANCALVRELHVYGKSLGVKQSNTSGAVQHRGFGQLLMATAEQIALQHNYPKIAVISGVGVREYYRQKCGYSLESTYMTKKLDHEEYNQKKFTNGLFMIFFWGLVIGICRIIPKVF
jgi:ELP3 family radical SAM enzyme/protein acetyltransferase